MKKAQIKLQPSGKNPAPGQLFYFGREKPFTGEKGTRTTNFFYSKKAKEEKLKYAQV